MLQLSRTVRFCLTKDRAALQSPRDNTFSAWPAMRGLGRYYELVVTCRGEADPQTGYFINIKEIDQVVREHALPLFLEQIADDERSSQTPMGAFMRRLFDCISPELGGTLHHLSLCLTPYLKIAIERNDMDHVLLQQQYEFSAAHRLHVDALSNEENRSIFGKCNNPAGHGHNYRLEVTARCPIDEHGQTLDPSALDAAVNRYVIDELDHKHLNEDVPAFAELNPSVEHIVRVIWQMLEEHMPGASALDELKLWETGKTVCAYRGPMKPVSA